MLDARISDGSLCKPRQPLSDRRRWRERGLAAWRGIDVPALAILIVPLMAMVLLHVLWRSPRDVSSRPTPVPEMSVHVAPELVAAWHGDLALEDMPLMPDGAGRTSLALTEPPLPPWHGDVALEDMPVVPDRAVRTALALADPPPPPWHGDLALADMPALPDVRTRAARAPVTGRADVAATPTPICLPTEPGVLSMTARDEPDATPRQPVAFGRALAAAARAQLDDFVIYNPRYVTLAYPRGDTQPLYGVCTDVVVRAYRTFGIDFQELIHTSRLGRGDPSIDHRRVEVIRRFLERHGTSFEISEFPEDFLPGDIVTYHRPEGRVSQQHIAVVADQLAPSGRPLIVHNRGWGPQLEDALFADRITGHYRFSPADAEAFVRTRQPRATGRPPSGAVSVAAGR
jgi:uncharacterized protein YijF (DUF1287 family)